MLPTSGKINVGQTRQGIAHGPVSLKGQGLVRLESLSWIDVIKKKYPLSDKK